MYAWVAVRDLRFADREFFVVDHFDVGEEVLRVVDAGLFGFGEVEAAGAGVVKGGVEDWLLM